jgi:ribosomal protein L16 Arg81 hydroxylase
MLKEEAPESALSGITGAVDNTHASVVDDLNILSTGTLGWIRQNMKLLDPSSPNGLPALLKIKSSVELAELCLLWARFQPDDNGLQEVTAFVREIWQDPNFAELLAADTSSDGLFALAYCALAPVGTASGFHRTLLAELEANGDLLAGVANSDLEARWKVPYSRLETRFFAELAGLDHRIESYAELYAASIIAELAGKKFTSITRPESYTITHTIWYLTDFGFRDPVLAEADREQALGVVDKLTRSCIRGNEWDLLTEFLLAQFCLDRDSARSTSVAAGITLLRQVQLANGAIPGRSAGQRPAESATPAEFFQSCFHPTVQASMASLALSYASRNAGSQNRRETPMAKVIAPADEWYNEIVGADELKQTTDGRLAADPKKADPESGADVSGPARLGLDTFGLERLISPLDIETFQRDFWEQKPLIIERDDPKYYADLLTIDDVDQLLSLSGPKFDNILLVENHKSSRVVVNERSEKAVLKEIYDRYRRGATIVMNSLHSRWEPLQRLAETLGMEIGAVTNANVYITPGGAQGFPRHHDDHDVLVTQVFGSKEWRLYGIRHQLPVDSGRYQETSSGSSRVRQKFCLETGDLLYLPRGIIHAASSQQTASIHCTIGIRPLLWGKVLKDAISEILDEDIQFRRSLPIGIAHNPAAPELIANRVRRLFEDVVRQFSPDSAAAATIRKVSDVNLPSLRGHLTATEDGNLR